MKCKICGVVYGSKSGECEHCHICRNCQTELIYQEFQKKIENQNWSKNNGKNKTKNN
jgi:hypothetical protein